MAKQREGVTVITADTFGNQSVSGGADMRLMVELLKAGLNDDRVEAQEYSLWSLSMISDPSRRKHMAEEGCIPALIQSLRSGKLSADSQEHAAVVLACLLIDEVG